MRAGAGARLFVGGAFQYGMLGPWSGFLAFLLIGVLQSPVGWGFHDCISNSVLIGVGQFPSKRVTATTSAGSAPPDGSLINRPAVQRCTRYLYMDILVPWPVASLP